MKKQYQQVTWEIVLIIEDTVRCSNIFEKGDDGEEDIFG